MNTCDTPPAPHLNYTGCTWPNAGNGNASTDTPAHWAYADLTGVSLVSAYVGTYVGYANLTGANLTGANLTGSYWAAGLALKDANLTNANLSHLSFGYPYSSPMWTGATFKNTTCPDGSNSDNNVGATCEGHA